VSPVGWSRLCRRHHGRRTGWPFFSGLLQMTLHFDKFRLVGLQLLCIVIFFQYHLDDFFFIFLFEDFQNIANLNVRSCMFDFRLNFLYNLSDLSRWTGHLLFWHPINIFISFRGFHRYSTLILFFSNHIPYSVRFLITLSIFIHNSRFDTFFLINELNHCHFPPEKHFHDHFFYHLPQHVVKML
jgi:hypothetical protein